MLGAANMPRFAAVICMVLLSASAAGDGSSIGGRASVIDGDTIEIRGERFRILDIDAPESEQTCKDQNGAVWHCGQKASLALSDWIGTRSVTCDTTKKDIYKRWLARCSVGGSDVAEWMARRGWAVPYRDCKCEVIRAAADHAKSSRIGIWSGTFVMPWNWRSGQRSSAADVIEPSPSLRDRVTRDGIGGTMIYATDVLLGALGAALVIVLYHLFKGIRHRPGHSRGKIARPFVRRHRWPRLLSRSLMSSLVFLIAASLYFWPQAREVLSFAPLSLGGCNIKGNISFNGEHIYHLPGGKWYDVTKINESRGERWFCSEAEARAAGWRRAIEW